MITASRMEGNKDTEGFSKWIGSDETKNPSGWRCNSIGGFGYDISQCVEIRGREAL
jgi:hypothetical protein